MNANQMTVKPQTLQQIVESLHSDIEKLRFNRLYLERGSKEERSITSIIQLKELKIKHLEIAIESIEVSRIETELTQVALVLRSNIGEGK